MGFLQAIPDLIKAFAETAAMTADLSSMGREYLLLRTHRQDLLAHAPRGGGRAVLVLPGFAMNDHMTQPMRDVLTDLGYSVYGWGGGINRGPDDKTLTHIKTRLADIHSRHNGQKVLLIGHSLGGFYARELNREFPHLTARPITLGTPFAAPPDVPPSGQVLRTAFEMVNGDKNRLMTDDALLRRAAIPPPSPTTSIYTRHDGIVHWPSCLNPRRARTENIEIDSTHCGLIFNPMALLVIADRLAQTSSKHWKPFDPAAYSDFPLRLRPDQAHLGVIPISAKTPAALLRGPGLFAAA